ncbi:MAG: AAA family ATPase [Lachnospiraceae bacterium]|nr:AAA family ATPase [Lachnospiraceae bacterium]
MSKSIMLNENSRKSATKIVLVNWSRFSNVPIALEGSTLFTGVNGSGKSTILDAVTYMLTGNTQFNKAALDRDRNVVSYVRGDTKSEGKNRFIREGEVTSYIAMEFWAPLEKQYLVVGVCIEYVNETSITKKWFVFKDTKIDDCRFYTVKEKKVTVYPRHELMVKGKKIPAGEFMNRDKGTEQVLRALGLRCGVEKYRAKLVKMMAFNPENNIDKFIQECVLDEYPIRSMSDIREHRNNYNDAKKAYEELANGKSQLEVVQAKIVDYEAWERKYEIRRILLLYQEMKWYQEHRGWLEEKINIDKARLYQLQNQLENLTEKRKNALDRKINAEKNELLCSIEEITKSLKNSISVIEKEIEKYKRDLEKLQSLETGIQNIMDWLETDGELTDKEVAVIETVAASTFNIDEKVAAFIKFRNIVSEKKANYQTNKVHISDRIEEVKKELEELQEKISRLESDVLPFEKKYEEAKQIIKLELKKINIKTDVRLFAEMVQHVDRNWQLAIETFLGKKRFDIIVNGQYCEKVMKIVHEHQLKDIKVVITDKLPKTDIIPESAAAMLDIPNEYGRRYANYLLNGIHLCNNIQEIHQFPKGGLMIDGTLAKSFTMSCMNLQRTQIFMGKDAIKQQLSKAKSDKYILEQEEKKLIECLNILNKYIADIEAVNWDETRYVFDAQKCIDEKITEIRNKEAELIKIEDTPGFAAALQEKESADKEYKEVDEQFININNDINTCKERICNNEDKYDESKLQIEKAKREYDSAILQRLELRKEIVELYDRLRIKSESARVMTAKNVENIRGEKDNVIRILENEQRKYWHIIGLSDEKYGIGYIPLFREQYREIANVKIEEAKHKLEEKQHELENAFMVDFVAEINEAIREAKEEIDEINKALKDIPFGKDTYQFKMFEKPDRMLFFNLCKKLESYMNSMDAYRAMNQSDEEMEYNIRQFMDTILEEENEEEYTDYRKYFKYDMRILSKQDGENVAADLSKKQGSASNGEKQTPYFIILAASLLQCYPKNVSCARLAFIDEAFSALSRERIEQMVKFFEDNKFQVIYAAPPEKIDSIGSYINSTISLCMKGKYTWAVEGLVKSDEFATE